MFPHRRTPTVERLYLLCFVSTRLVYVALLWHEIFFNYPDKSVAFLYTITISLHVYWFVLYIQTQRKFRAKQRRLEAAAASEQALALEEKRQLAETSDRPVAVGPEDNEEVLMDSEHDEDKQYEQLQRSNVVAPSENRSSIELEERDHFRPLVARNSTSRGGHHEL